MSQYAPEGNSVGVAISQPWLRCAAPLPWVSSPTLLATLQELRLAEGVTINLPKWRLLLFTATAGLFNRPWAAFPTMVPASFSLKVEAMQIPILAMSRDYTSWYAPEGNSVGVAISQPRVEARSASTLGIIPHPLSNSTGVALSRRRYHQSSEIEAILPYKIRIMSLSTHSSPDKR